MRVNNKADYLEKQRRRLQHLRNKDRGHVKLSFVNFSDMLKRRGQVTDLSGAGKVYSRKTNPVLIINGEKR